MDADAKYAIAFSRTPNPEDGIFLVYFNTRDEQEVLKLSKCIVGENGLNSIVIATNDGKIYPLLNT